MYRYILTGFWESWPRGYKTFSVLNSASTKFILLINVKMPTIVGILTFISMINITSERLKARNFICMYFSLYDQLKFHAQLSWAWTFFYKLTSGPGTKHLKSDRENHVSVSLFQLILSYEVLTNNFLHQLIDLLLLSFLSFVLPA